MTYIVLGSSPRMSWSCPQSPNSVISTSKYFLNLFLYLQIHFHFLNSGQHHPLKGHPASNFASLLFIFHRTAGLKDWWNNKSICVTFHLKILQRRPIFLKMKSNINTDYKALTALIPIASYMTLPTAFQSQDLSFHLLEYSFGHTFWAFLPLYHLFGSFQLILQALT